MVFKPSASPFTKVHLRMHRNPRPQLPTKAALGRIESLKTEKTSIDVPSKSFLREEDPWRDTLLLGVLVQEKNKWSVTVCNGALSLMKKMEINAGKQYLEKMKLFTHSNVATIQETFAYKGELYMRFEYCRFTLEEVLHVHQPLEEKHILAVAHPIFHAIKHVAAAGIVHNAISAAAVRICGRSGKIMLSNFDDCILQSTELSPNIDLQQLGFTILECMEGTLSERLRDAHYVLSQRETNKMFGLERGERWSGCKLLVDFLDDLFNEHKQALAKFERPHDFVKRSPSTDGTMLPFTELVTLECFARWRAAPGGAGA